MWKSESLNQLCKFFFYNLLKILIMFFEWDKNEFTTFLPLDIKALFYVQSLLNKIFSWIPYVKVFIIF